MIALLFIVANSEYDNGEGDGSHSLDCPQDEDPLEPPKQIIDIVIVASKISGVCHELYCLFVVVDMLNPYGHLLSSYNDTPSLVKSDVQTVVLVIVTIAQFGREDKAVERSRVGSGVEPENVTDPRVGAEDQEHAQVSKNTQDAGQVIPCVVRTAVT